MYEYSYQDFLQPGTQIIDLLVIGRMCQATVSFEFQLLVWNKERELQE